MLPLVMEQMPAAPSDALSLSRHYVDQADFYVGIFAFRYGFVPERQDSRNRPDFFTKRSVQSNSAVCSIRCY